MCGLPLSCPCASHVQRDGSSSSCELEDGAQFSPGSFWAIIKVFILPDDSFLTTTSFSWWLFGILMVILKRHAAVSCVRASPLAANEEGISGPALRMQSVCNADHHLMNSKHRSNICAAELIQSDPAWNKRWYFFLLEETQIPEIKSFSLFFHYPICLCYVHYGIVALPPLQVIPVVKALELYFKDFSSICLTLKWCRLQPRVASLQVYKDKLVQSDTPVWSHHQNKGASSTHPPGPESWSRIAPNDQIKVQQQKAL